MIITKITTQEAEHIETDRGLYTRTDRGFWLKCYGGKWLPCPSEEQDLVMTYNEYIASHINDKN